MIWGLFDKKSPLTGKLKAAGYGLFAILLTATQASQAKSWYDMSEDPQGKTRQLPLQIEKYPLGQATEKHYPPNLEFTLWIQDETLFKPKGEVVRTENYLNRMTEWRVCSHCEQETPVKKDGFFYAHKSSTKGHVSNEEAKLSGKPARVRGRRQ